MDDKKVFMDDGVSNVIENGSELIDLGSIVTFGDTGNDTDCYEARIKMFKSLRENMKQQVCILPLILHHLHLILQNFTCFFLLFFCFFIFLQEKTRVRK